MNDQSLNDFLGDLKEENFSINRQEIREISEFILGISYVDLLIGSPKISTKEKELFINLVKRRSKGEPLAYLIEKKGFWNLDLFVDSSVLVPRPETETIIEDVLDSFDHPFCNCISVHLSSIIFTSTDVRYPHTIRWLICLEL